MSSSASITSDLRIQITTLPSISNDVDSTSTGRNLKSADIVTARCWNSKLSFADRPNILQDSSDQSRMCVGPMLMSIKKTIAKNTEDITTFMRLLSILTKQPLYCQSGT